MTCISSNAKSQTSTIRCQCRTSDSLWSYWESGEPEFSQTKQGYIKTFSCSLRDGTTSRFHKEPLCELPYPAATTQAPATTGALISSEYLATLFSGDRVEFVRCYKHSLISFQFCRLFLARTLVYQPSSKNMTGGVRFVDIEITTAVPLTSPAATSSAVNAESTPLAVTSRQVRETTLDDVQRTTDADTTEPTVTSRRLEPTTAQSLQRTTHIETTESVVTSLAPCAPVNQPAVDSGLLRVGECVCGSGLSEVTTADDLHNNQCEYRFARGISYHLVRVTWVRQDKRFAFWVGKKDWDGYIDVLDNVKRYSWHFEGVNVNYRIPYFVGAAQKTSLLCFWQMYVHWAPFYL